jgi:hypothetical protein
MSQNFKISTAITHGLIIDQPWIDFILRGNKCWELRSSLCSKRGSIALIRKGSKAVVGLAQITGSDGPFSKPELISHFDKHCVPAELILKEDYNWLHAWKLEQVITLDVPIPYIHKNGAVIWVELDDTVQQLLQDYPKKLPVLPTQVAQEKIESLLVPIARDGTIFSPALCSRNGIYTVGNKGEEERFSSFSDALDYLRKMPIARWRRPNENGNWGIVSAVEWID